MAVISDLFINGIRMPAPTVDGVTIKLEPIWSANTGRTSSGKMVGTIVAVKTTLSLKWALLSMSDAKRIADAVNGDTPFFPVRFTDMGGVTRTLTMYNGTPSFTQYSWAEGLQWVKNISVDLIEQ